MTDVKTSAKRLETQARAKGARAASRTVQMFLRDYEWVHTLIGVFGNFLFLVGSVLFLWESTKRMGVWLFIVGAGAMLIGSAGAAIVRLTRSRRQNA